MTIMTSTTSVTKCHIKPIDPKGSQAWMLNLCSRSRQGKATSGLNQAAGWNSKTVYSIAHGSDASPAPKGVTRRNKFGI